MNLGRKVQSVKEKTCRLKDLLIAWPANPSVRQRTMGDAKHRIDFSTICGLFGAGFYDLSRRE